MDAALNPFSPGAGLRPPALVGRDAELEAFDTMVARARLGHLNRAMVLSGLRGVGKTVLLNEMRVRAERSGWLVVSLEGQRADDDDRDVRRRLARELLGAGRRLLKPGLPQRLRQALGSISSFGVSAGVTGITLNVDTNTGRADSGDLETDLAELVEDLADALAEKGSAFALFIDEMQDLNTATLSALLAAQHSAGQRSRPFYVFGAGLPSLPSVLSDARSYAERLFDYVKVGALAPQAAERALLEPAHSSGADLSGAALQVLTAAAQGYPYFLQEFGRAVWDLAPRSPFTRADAEVAVEYGRSRLDDGFFRSRWDRATPAERRLLQAMASDDPTTYSVTSEIAERLNKPISGIGPARSSLIEKGLVYAPEHGRLAYTVPGMAHFIQRQATS